MTIRPFEPNGATQNAVMDGSVKTITVSGISDKEGSVNIVVVGTQTVYVRLDGTTPTTANAKPLLSNTDQTLSMPTGQTAVKLIGAAGSTVYVTAGRYI